MAGQIRITPEEMEQRATEFKQKADDLNTFINDIDSLTARTREEWEGEASIQFEQQWTDVRPTYVTSQENLESISQQLTSTANAMRDMDQEIASGMGVK